MKELKRVNYTAIYEGRSYDISCWEGTSLDVVWNSQKSWYLPGARVTIVDNNGKSKTFVRGLI